MAYDVIWQDRDIRLDADINMLELRSGEFQIEKLDSIEDTKGNNGDKGILTVTNLRIIWYAHRLPKINLSIGFNCITGITTKIANSKLRGQTEALCILAKCGSTRFEFMFTSLNYCSKLLFASVISVHRAYDTTKLYRELKMRGSIIDDDRLKLLPLEEKYRRDDGVWSLTSDQGNLGSLVVTNIRIVWFAATNSYFNVSIPYLHVKRCMTKKSKFGTALVIETSHQSGDFAFGFRVDPKERLEQLEKEINNFWAAYHANPIFGIEFTKELDSMKLTKIESPADEDIEIDSEISRADALTAYFACGGTQRESKGPTFSEELGVAIETLKDGFTLKDLWEINLD